MITPTAMKELTELTRDRDDDDEEVWVTHYSSNQQILLVGEGDFSFSSSLATRFGSAPNICASSLDSYDDVVKKYAKARSNLETLKRLGASLLHGVDATKLQFHPDLHFRRFDRIIFNFPHAGFHSSKESDSHLIQKHRALLFGFFHGASHMLRADGEIHVSHKNKPPFCHWKLEELASKCSLVLKQCVAFDKSEYPGYENKRGDGSKCDQPFYLGDCSTFKFRFSRVAKEFYAEKVKSRESKCPQARHPLATSPLDLSYYYHEEHRRSHFQDALQGPVSFAHQDYSIQRDKLVFTERSSFPFQAGYHHKEQSLECCSRFDEIYSGEQQRRLPWTTFPPRYAGESLERHQLLGQDFPVQATQEPFFERSNNFNGVYNWEQERMLTRTTFPHWYSGESPERRRLLCQNFPVRASQEPFFNRPNRFNGDPHGIYYGEEGRMLTFTSFHHPYK